MRMPAGDSGSVTAETAVVLPVLVLVVAVLFGITRGIDAELSIQDAARVGARAAARGEPAAEVRRLAASVAPAGATVEVRHAGGLVDVVVRARVRPMGAAARFMPLLDLSARSVAADDAGLGGTP
jgi:Flp pilus assembly protein TadG